MEEKGDRKAILVVSFGTSYEETREKTIGATEKRIAGAFPDYEVRRAFTSSIIQRVLKKRGVDVDNVEEALEKMAADGFTEVIVQPLHLMAGEEYHVKVLGQSAPFRERFARFAVGMPLFADPAGYETTIDAIAQSLPAAGPGEAVILMGHGTHHPSNAVYPMVHMMFEDRNLPVYVGTLEGYPELGHVMTRLKRDEIQKVYLLPMMIVAGDHANNDMAGDEEDSWVTVLEAEGFETQPILRGLGEVPGIQDIFVSRAAKAIASLSVE